MMTSDSSLNLVDMHMHAGFSQEPDALATALAGDGIAAFSNTVTPLEYLRLAAELDAPNMRLGVGLHPWWVGTEEAGELMEALMLFEDGLMETRFVGEIGLDFWPKHEHSRQEQLLAFKHIAMLCAREGDCLISMHSVKAERELLDILEDSGCLASCTCILHSYGGPSDQLKRAIETGCYFSVGKRMLSTKKGREYARIIPEDKLLIESDLPDKPSDDTTALSIADELNDVIDTLANIRKRDRSAFKDEITIRGLHLLEYAQCEGLCGAEV